jgi:hypothetical protein
MSSGLPKVFVKFSLLANHFEESDYERPYGVLQDSWDHLIRSGKVCQAVCQKYLVTIQPYQRK